MNMPYVLFASHVYINPESNEIRSFIDMDRHRISPSTSGTISPILIFGPTLSDLIPINLLFE